MNTCQYVQYQFKPRREGTRQIWPTCDQPATKLWTPRKRPAGAMLVCELHGLALAGNWTDELKAI